MVKKALITGVTGQDGSYLVEYLLKKKYEVHGIVRRTSTFNRGRIEKFLNLNNLEKKNKFNLHYGDLVDSGSLTKVLAKVKPDEVYH
jgi:GDP-D-mannose dehydratase